MGRNLSQTITFPSTYPDWVLGINRNPVLPIEPDVEGAASSSTRESIEIVSKVGCNQDTDIPSTGEERPRPPISASRPESADRKSGDGVASIQETEQ